MAKKNTLFPGRPNYVGPTTGMFGFLHHEVLCESSHDVMERVEYVEWNKAPNEVAIRLHNMIYLGDCPQAAEYKRVTAAALAEYKHVTAPAWAEYKRVRAAAWAEYDRVRNAAGAPILAYIKKHIPDCAWNGKTLVFPKC